MKKATLSYALRVLFVLCGLLPALRSQACHGLALIGVSYTANSTGITINASSDAASCGCGPYYMEVQVNNVTYPFSATAPAASSSAWGTMPWFHSLLNVAGYTAANGWPDNCVIEPYTAITINYSALCPYASYTIRVREHVDGSMSDGPWSAPYTFTTPGAAPAVYVTASASNLSVCDSAMVTLNAVGSGGCTGPYTYSWYPPTGLSTPNAASTTAFVTSTKTYTVVYTDMSTGAVAFDSVTITANPSPSLALDSIVPSTCNGTTGTATVSTSSGTPAYSYFWPYNSATTANNSGLASGTYMVYVVDANGCIDSMNVVVGDSCDYVWPGDANDDAVADMNDILDIGVANGATGTTRPGASLTWIGQPSAPWGTTLLSGTDYKFVDCNGDGTIDLNDTTAVLLNFGYIHNNRWAPPANVLTAPTLQLKLAQDTIPAGTSSWFDLYLGTQNLPVNNAYGLAVSIDFNAAQLFSQSMSLDLSGSWIGTTGTDLAGVKYAQPNTGRLELAMTRYNHMAANGNGLIAHIPFTTTQALIGSGTALQVPITIQYIKLIDNAGNEIQVNTENDTLTLYDPGPLSTFNANATSTDINAIPNPANDQVQISWANDAHAPVQLSLLDVTGRTVFSAENITNGNYRFSTSALPAGVYFVRVQGAELMKQTRLLIQR